MDLLIKAMRWVLALPLGLFAGTIVWFASSASLDAFGVEAPDWRFFLVMTYTWMAAGFVFAGTATKLAPANRSRVAVVMIGIALAGGFLLIMRGEHGLAASTVFGFSLFAGAVGYALRLRGFSDAVGVEA